MKILLDEMHSPAVARALRALHHDVIAIAEHPELRSLPDDEVYLYAVAHDRCVVTENVKDFRRLHARAEETGAPRTRLLYTSSRTFKRSRRDFGPFVEALVAWIGAPHAAGTEAWLKAPRPRPVGGSA
ncbi:DUF5615 family PIN-like protein [Longispora sp. NPDC051575]|uniref:DUF5615 family PIN-like protein n=1 Tax=Longispora sp. NPDC051575 TaxID=3154943 RepID=UPI0034311C85